MSSRGTELRKKIVALFLVGTIVMSGCSGSGSSDTKAPAGPVASTLQTATDGWSFPNFPASTYPDVNFDESDLVAMFGSGDKVCVDGNAAPCVLTAEASAWARMVNQARASGHCEGLVALASSRFNGKESPSTVELPTQGETLHAIMRTFATQFIPEVQVEIQKWLSSSLDDKVDALKTSIAAGKLDYTLGLYTAGGGHALLPYAIEYPEESKPRIMLYDSNWPGKNRYVDIDLKAKTWRFSFSGEDPENDPDMWTGGPDAMDLTPLTARAGTCPFCGGDVKVAKTTMLIRSSNLDWSVESNGETVSPSQPGSGDGITTRPVKGGLLFSATGEKLTKESYDYVVEIPEVVADGSTTTVASASKRISNLKFKGVTSVYALLPSGIAQFTTPGESDEPVVMQGSSISASDPGINMTLASGNLVANASGSAVSLSIEGETMAVAVTTANGQVVQQEVSADKPTLQMKADPSGGGITVLAATSSGVVEKTEVSSSGEETKSVVTEKLELNAVTAVLPPELASKESTLLPSLANRDMANPNYKVDAPYSAPTTVPQKETNNQATDTSTTIAASRSNQGNEPSKSSPTTIGKSTGSTEVDAVKPTLGRFSISAVTFGDAAFEVKEPTSTSSAAWKFASSKTDVATINSSSGRVTIVGAGSTVITASQAAIKGFEAISVTATLVVNRDTPTLGAWSAITKTFGDEAFVIKDPTSNSKGEITFATSDDDVARINKTSGRVVLFGAGRTTITATQAATDDYAAATKTLVLTVNKGIPDLGAFDDMSKTFGDGEFVIAKPNSTSTGAVTFTSSNSDVLRVTVEGTATIVGAGSAIVTASQAESSNYSAKSVTATVSIAKAAPVISNMTIGNLTYGNAEVTLAPKSTSPAAFSFSSNLESVVKINKTTGKMEVTGAGEATITASQESGDNYEAASESVTITIAKASASVGIFAAITKDIGDAPFTITAPTSTNTKPFTFASDNSAVATVDETTGVVTVVGPGSAIITASQIPSDNYKAVTATTTLTVNKRTPVFGTFSIPAKNTGQANFTVSGPTSTSNGAFSFTSSATDVATINANTGEVTIKAAGSTTITATQAATTTHSAKSTTAVLTVTADRAFSGMSPATAATSATQLKTVNGYTISGNYWIKPTGYTGAAQKVWVEFDRDGKSYVLIGKGRQSNDVSGGWFGTDSELATGGLLQENASSAGISKLSAEFVNFLMNGTADGWTNSDAENYLVVNRIATATDGYEGIGDSFKLKVTSSTRFTWVNQFGSANIDGWPNGLGELTRYSTQWMTGTNDGTSTDRLADNWFGCNCAPRLFTFQWAGHGSYHGWSSGDQEARGFVNTDERHAIQFVQLWLRS